MVDVTPIVPAGRQLVESYGDGRFRISGAVYEGSVIIQPDRTTAWAVAAFEEVTAESFGVLDAEPPDILLLGCGTSMRLVPPALRRTLRERGMVVEPMDTGAACRTYNVLLAEGRRVAAAVIAI